jgi:hypothetical protein
VGPRTLRKAFCLFLVCLLCLDSSLALSAPSEGPVYIQISAQRGARPRSVQVYPEGDDYLIEAELLSEFTPYTYGFDGDLITYTRGAKVIRINAEKGKMTVYRDDVTQVTVKKIDGKYYLAMSEILPWLNVYTSVKDGVLYIAADAVSIWDLILQFDPNKVLFDFLKECKKANVSANKLKILAALDQLGLGTLLQLVPIDWKVSLKGYLDYYRVFESIFQDYESIYDAANKLLDTKRLNSGFDLIEQFGAVDLLPDELLALFLALKGADKAKLKEVIGVLSYVEAFARDNSEKLAMMDNIIVNRHINDYPEPAVAAAMAISRAYKDKWKGIETKLTNELAKYTTQALGVMLAPANLVSAIELVSGMMGITTHDWRDKIADVSIYTKLQNAARKGYLQAGKNLGLAVDSGGIQARARWGEILEIRRLRCEAMLLLISAKRGNEAMKEYFRAKGNWKLVQEYTEKMQECDRWYALFLASSVAEVNDSRDDKEDKAREIIGHLKQVARQQGISFPNHPNDMGFYGSNGSFVRMDMSVDQVKKILGEPKRETRLYSDFIGYHLEMEYPGATLTFRSSLNAFDGFDNIDDFDLCMVTIKSRDVVGPRGIKVGDSLESVLGMFPSEEVSQEVIDEFILWGVCQEHDVLLYHDTDPDLRYHYYGCVRKDEKTKQVFMVDFILGIPRSGDFYALSLDIGDGVVRSIRLTTPM